MPRGVKGKRQSSNQPEQQTRIRDTMPATTEADALRVDNHSNTSGRNEMRGFRNGSGSTGTTGSGDKNGGNGTSSNNGGQNGKSSSRQSNESSGRQSNESSGGRSSENSGGKLATALTRDDIPVLVREISCQLRPINPEVHAPLVPDKICDVAYFVRCEVLGST